MIFVEHHAEGYLLARIVAEGAQGQHLVEAEVGGSWQQWRISSTSDRHLCDSTQVDIAPDNLLSLADFNYAALLHALRLRHHQCLPYTWIGPVLVAINPCSDLGSFSQSTVQNYLKPVLPGTQLLPHPFATVTYALQGDGPTAILVNGESGAGKTETVKAMLSFLVARQGTDNERVCSVLVDSTKALEAFGNARTLQNYNSSRFGKLTEVFLDAETGHARGATVVPYMLESSRVTHHARGEQNYHIFYVLAKVLQFSLHGKCNGAFWGSSDLLPAWHKLVNVASKAGFSRSPYLAPSPTPGGVVQTPRIALPAFQTPCSIEGSEKVQGEESMVSAARSEEEVLTSTQAETKNHPNEFCFEEILESLRAVGLTDKDVLAGLQLVLAVALFGHVLANDVLPAKAGKDSLGSGDSSLSATAREVEGQDTEGASETTSALREIADLLQVPLVDLQDFLATRTTDAPRGGERIVQPRTTWDVLTLRDSVARELYAALFSWLVCRVAAAAAPAPSAVEPTASAQLSTFALSNTASWQNHITHRHRLAILDIYGFEVCQSNGLEQMLINYCNEKLQALFNVQMFAAEAREYDSEGLPPEVWAPLCQNRDLPALLVFEGRDTSQAAQGGRRCPGLFALVDDEARICFNGGSSTALRSKLDAALSSSAAYKSCRNASCFAISHFAGDVVYDSRNFVETNANAARPEILAFFMSRSKSNFLHSVLSTRLKHRKQDVGGVEMSQGRRHQLFGRTVAQAFRTELDQLLNSFENGKTMCYYVRCLKPNRTLQPLQFEGSSILRQCRYSGLLETVLIRQCGYPHRWSIPDFLHRYAPLLWPQELVARTPNVHRPLRELSISLCRMWASSIIKKAVAAGDLKQEDVLIGHTKVFMRPKAFAHLESLHALGSTKAIPIQAAYRGFESRLKFQLLRRLAIRLQALARGRRARKLLRYNRGIVRFQACFRGFRVRRAVRAYVELKAIEERAVVLIQRRFRTYRSRCALLLVQRRAAARQAPLSNITVHARGHGPQTVQGRASVPNFKILHAQTKENQLPASRGAASRLGTSISNSKRPAREVVGGPAKENQQSLQKHKSQMGAMQAQFEALRQHRTRLLRDLADTRPAPPAQKPCLQRSCGAPHNNSRMPPPLRQRSDSFRSKASGAPSSSGSGPQRFGTPLANRQMVRDGSSRSHRTSGSPLPMATDPWATFAVNGREQNGNEMQCVPAAGSRASSPSSARTRSPRANPSSRGGVASSACSNRSISPRSDRHAPKNVEIVQDIMSKCGKISDLQKSIDQSSLSSKPIRVRPPASNTTSRNIATPASGYSTPNAPTGGAPASPPAPVTPETAAGRRDPRTIDRPSCNSAGRSLPTSRLSTTTSSKEVLYSPMSKRVPSIAKAPQASPGKRMMNTPSRRAAGSQASPPPSRRNSESQKLGRSSSTSSSFLRRASVGQNDIKCRSSLH